MPQGNQSDFMSTNESVEKYVIVGEDYRWDIDNNNEDVKVSTGERILGLYKDIKAIKSALRFYHSSYYLNTKIIKVRITIEELEEIILK